MTGKVITLTKTVTTVSGDVRTSTSDHFTIGRVGQFFAGQGAAARLVIHTRLGETVEYQLADPAECSDGSCGR
jgi:hypothetical protein